MQNEKLRFFANSFFIITEKCKKYHYFPVNTNFKNAAYADKTRQK